MKLRPQLHPLHEVSQDALEGDLQELINKYRRPENTHDADAEVRRSPRMARRNHFKEDSKHRGNPPPIHALIAELSRGLKADENEQSDEEGGVRASRRAPGRNVRKRSGTRGGGSVEEKHEDEDSDSGAALLLELAGGGVSTPAKDRHSGRQRQRVRRYEPDENMPPQRASSRVRRSSEEREDSPATEEKVPEGRRCVIKGGTGWRCPREAMIGLRHCEQHLTRMRERRQMKEEEACPVGDGNISGGGAERAPKGPPKRRQCEQDAMRGGEELPPSEGRTGSPEETEGRRVRRAKREWKEEDDAVRARGGARVKVNTKKRSRGGRRKPAEGMDLSSAQQESKLAPQEENEMKAGDQAACERGIAGLSHITEGGGKLQGPRPEGQAKDTSGDSLRCEELLEREAQEASDVGGLGNNQLAQEPAIPVRSETCTEAKMKSLVGTADESAARASHNKRAEDLGKKPTSRVRKQSASSGKVNSGEVKKVKKRVRRVEVQGALPALTNLPKLQKSPLESDSDQEPIACKKRKAGSSEEGQRPKAALKSKRVIRPVILGSSLPLSDFEATVGGPSNALQPQVFGEEERLENNTDADNLKRVQVCKEEDESVGNAMEQRGMSKRERDEHVSQMMTLMASLVAPKKLPEGFETFAFPPSLVDNESGNTSDEEPIGTRLKGKSIKVKSEAADEETGHVQRKKERAKKRPKREPSLECLETRTSDLSENSGRPKRKKDALKETLAKFSMPERISITEAAANGQPAAPIFAGLTGRNAGLKLNPHGRGIRVSPMLMPRVVAERASPFAPLSGPITAELTASGSIHIDGPLLEGSPPPEAVRASTSPPPQPADLPSAIGIPAHIIPPGFQAPGNHPPATGVCFLGQAVPVPPSWDEPRPPMSAAPVSGGWDYPQLGSGVYDFAGQFLAPDPALAPQIKLPKRLEVAHKRTAEPSGGGSQRKIRSRGGAKAGVAENQSDTEVADTVMRLAATFKKAENGASTQQGGVGKLPPFLSAPRGPGTEYKDLKALLGMQAEQGRGRVKTEPGLIYAGPKRPVPAGKARLIQSARRGAASAAQGGGGHGRAHLLAELKSEGEPSTGAARLTDDSQPSSLPPSSAYLALNDEAFRSWAHGIKHASKNGQARERLHDSVTEVLKAAEAMLSGWKEAPQGGGKAAPEKKGTFKLFGKEVSSGPPQAGIARPLTPAQERPDFGFGNGQAPYPHLFRGGLPARGQSYPLFRPPPPQVSNEALMLPMLWNAPQFRAPGQAVEPPSAQIVAELKLSGGLRQGFQEPPKRSYNWWEQDQAILMGVTPV